MNREHWIRRATLAALCQLGVAYLRTIWEFANGFAQDELPDGISMKEVRQALSKFVTMGLVADVRQEYALI